MTQATSMLKKYGVPKSSVSQQLKNKENMFLVLQKLYTRLNQEKICASGYGGVDKAILLKFPSKISQNVPIDAVLLKEKKLKFYKTVRSNQIHCITLLFK